MIVTDLINFNSTVIVTDLFEITFLWTFLVRKIEEIIKIKLLYFFDVKKMLEISKMPKKTSWEF